MTLRNKSKDKGKVAPPKPTYVSRDNMRELLRIFNAEMRMDSRKKSVKPIIQKFHHLVEELIGQSLL